MRQLKISNAKQQQQQQQKQQKPAPAGAVADVTNDEVLDPYTAQKLFAGGHIPDDPNPSGSSKKLVVRAV